MQIHAEQFNCSGRSNLHVLTVVIFKNTLSTTLYIFDLQYKARSKEKIKGWLSQISPQRKKEKN